MSNQDKHLFNTATIGGEEIEFVNLTLHPVDIICQDGTVVSIKTSITDKKDCPRVKMEFSCTNEVEVDGHIFELFNSGVVTQIEPPLPPEKPGVLYIVSKLIVDSAPERKDLVCPVELERDLNTGDVVGCRGLSR